MRLVIAWILAAICATGLAQQQSALRLPITDTRVARLGRSAPGPDDSLRLGYPGSGIVVRFRGLSLSLRLSSSSATNAITVVVDHGVPQLVVPANGEQEISLVNLADPSSAHTVEMIKRSETWQGLLTLEGLRLGVEGELLDAQPLPARKLLFLGDSVTCGAGVGRDDSCKSDAAHPNGDPYHAFDMVLGRRLDAQVQLVCYGGRGLERDYRGLSIKDGVVNAPDFLDLAIATDEPGRQQPWNPAQWTPDGIVVSLGTNDFNLQKTKPLDGDRFVDDYVALLKRLRQEYPNSAIFATEGAIVTDPLLRTFVQHAVQTAHDPSIMWAPATHYPGNSCDAHPTLAQHQRMADDLEPLLRRTLGW